MPEITDARHNSHGSDDPNIQVMGPFIDGNDNLYVIAERVTFTDRLGIFKSTDDGATWAEVDGSNRPTISNNLATWSVTQVGTVLHIATLSHGYSSGMDVAWDIQYHTVNTSDASANADTWQTKNETVVSPLGAGQASNATVDIDVRSDGDVIIVHQGSDVAIMGSGFQRVAYSRKESGSWTTNIELHTTGSDEVAQRTVNCVFGTGDNLHIFWWDFAVGVNEGYCKTLDSGNSLSTRVQFHDDIWASDRRPKPISYDRSGTQYVLVLFSDQSSFDFYSRELEEDGSNDISTNLSVQTMSSDNQVTPNLGLVQDLDSGDFWAAYRRVTTSAMHSKEKAGTGSWGSDTSRQTGQIRGSWWQAYARDGGKHLGYVYCDHDDATPQKLFFDEIETAAGGQSISVGTLAEVESLTPVPTSAISVGTLAEADSLLGIAKFQPGHIGDFDALQVGQHENPVHQIGTDLYTMGGTNTTTFEDMKVFKSSDDGVNWVEVAELTSIPTAAVVLRSLATTVASDDIHIINEAANGEILYSVFDPGTDAFTTSKEVVSPANVGSSNNHTSIVVRSDGSVVVFYRTVSSPFEMHYRIKNGSWGGEQTITADEGVDAIEWGSIVLGDSDRVHFFWANTTDGTIYHRALNSSDVLQTEQLVTTPSTSALQNYGSGRYAKSGGVRIGYFFESSTRKWGVIHADSADAPSWTVDTDLPDDQVFNHASHLTGLVGNDTDEEFILGFIQDSERSVNYVRRPDGGSWSADKDTLLNALPVIVPVDGRTYGDFGLRVSGGVVRLNWWSAVTPTPIQDWLYGEIGLGIIQAVGTLAETNALIPAGISIYKTIGTLAEVNSLVSFGVVTGADQTIPVATLVELEALVAIPGAKVVGIGTLAEIEALQPIRVLRKYDIGTLTEFDTLVAVGLDLDGSTNLFIAIDLTDALTLAQVTETNPAQGLGIVGRSSGGSAGVSSGRRTGGSSSDHAPKIYRPSRRIVRK